MAVSFVKNDLKVIASVDGALDPICFEVPGGEVDDDDDETEALPTPYEEYLTDLDEDHLRFVEGQLPSRFVMKSVLDWKTSNILKNKMIQAKRKKKGGGMDVDFKMGARGLDEVRATLIGIEHPPGCDPGDLVFSADIDGLASKDLMMVLDEVGIVNDLFAARSALKGSDKKKK